MARDNLFEPGRNRADDTFWRISNARPAQLKEKSPEAPAQPAQVQAQPDETVISLESRRRTAAGHEKS